MSKNSFDWGGLVAGIFLSSIIAFFVWAFGYELIYKTIQDTKAEQIKRQNYMTCVDTFLRGTYNLHRLGTHDTLHGHISGSFFLFSGGINGEVTGSTMVRFSFEKDGQYIFASLPFEKIRVNTNNNPKNPFIEFVGTDSMWYGQLDCADMDFLFQKNVKYAVIHCQENQFSKDINYSLGFK